MPDPSILAVVLKHPVPRFVGVGAVTGFLHLGGYLVLRGWLDPVGANAIALTVATLVNTEGHRALTFIGHRPDHRWRQHAKSGLALGLSLALSAVVLAMVAHTDRLLEAAAIVASDVAATIVRYLLLRLWVFAPGEP